MKTLFCSSTRPNRRPFVLLGALALSMAVTSNSSAADPKGDAAQPGETSKMGASEDMGEIKANSEADLKTARLHFSNGVNLLQESPPNYQDAWQQFRLALDLSGGSWKVRGNLGYCALKLERDGEALMHYRKYLEEGGEEINPQERADIERELLLLEGNMAWVAISSSDPEAEIAVSRDGSNVPTQAYGLSRGEAKLGLRAGDFDITATSTDGATLMWEPLLTPGKKATHHFDFEAAEASGATAAASQPAPPPEPAATPTTESGGPSATRLIGYGTLGVGVLLAGGGIITGVLATNKEQQAKENCLNNICPEADESIKDSAQRLATASTVLFITGGVLAATGVTLAILGKNSRSKEVARYWTRPGLATLNLSPGVAHTGGALFLTGTY